MIRRRSSGRRRDSRRRRRACRGSAPSRAPGCGASPGSGVTNEPTTYPAPGAPVSTVAVAERYGNFIGGAFVAPVGGSYRENLTPVNANFATIEQVKRFAVLERGLTQADGELIPTLKVRRAAVNERYRDRFEALYSAAAGADQVVGGETP